MPLVLRCPRCANQMKYQPLDGKPSGKTKRCVYCGYSMAVAKYAVRHVLR